MRRPHGAEPLGVALWVGVVALGLVWGTAAIADDTRQGLLAAPFVGRWRFDVDERFVLLVPAAAMVVATLWWGPVLSQRVAWRFLPLITGAAATLVAFALAASDGLSRVVHPLTTRWEYQPVAAEIDDPLVFLDTFVARIDTYPVHVQGHPPGATLAFWVLEAIGLGGGAWAAALVLAFGGMAAGGVLVSAQRVAGEAFARRAAPFLVITPAALWIGTSADALFSGVIALGVTLVIVAACGEPGARSALVAVAGGAVLALALHLTYGTVPLLLVPLAVCLHRRRVVPLLYASIGAAAVTAAFVAGGFWWFDGLEATRERYWDGIAAVRPWPYHLLAGNPSLLAVAIGPAAVAGLVVAFTRLRTRHDDADQHRGRWRLPVEVLLPLAAFAAVVVANASMLSKGEVERIWLPFVPWLLLASALVATDVRRARWWLAPPALAAVVLQAVLRSPW